MTPQELKNSILQLAIQGKLGEQRPEDGTAAELLDKILAATTFDKSTVVKKNAKGAKGNLTQSPQSPQRGAKTSRTSRTSREAIPDDEKPFDIPESWEWVRLGDMFNIVNGFTPLKSNPEFWANGDIPWFTINDVHRQGRFITTTEKHITKKALAKGSERIVPSDTVLLCCTASIGEYAFTKIPLTTNQQFNALVVKEPYQNLIDPLFVLEFVKTLKGKLIELAGKTTFNFVSVGKVSKILFPLPPLAEQKRIVAKIEELLPLIDRYEKAWSKLEDFNKRFPVDMQKSLLQMAIQGKLVEQRPEEGTAAELLEKILAAKNAKGAKKNLTRSRGARGDKAISALSASPREEISDDEKPFDIPENWEWVRLGDVASVLGGKRIPAGRQLTMENTGHIYIRVSDMKNDGVNMERLMYVPSDIYPSISRYIIKKEDVYITVAGTIGRIGKIPPELDGANLTENADRLVFEGIDQGWLIQCLKSALVQTQILDCTTKVGQPKLAIKRIQDLVIPLPPLAEQKRIVAKLEEILPLCERLK